jgi:DNA-binding XRE family transcriptional regulator
LYHFWSIFGIFLGKKKNTDRGFVMMQAVVYIGEKLKRARLAKAMNQRQLAERAGVTKTTLVQLENNRSQPHPSTLGKLADALDVSPADLIEGE